MTPPPPHSQRIKDLVATAKPMTEDCRREQLVSLAYGNAAMHNPAVTKRMVREALKVIEAEET